MGIPICSGDKHWHSVLCQIPKSSPPYDWPARRPLYPEVWGGMRGFFLSVVLEELFQSSRENAFSTYFSLYQTAVFSR